MNAKIIPLPTISSRAEPYGTSQTRHATSVAHKMIIASTANNSNGKAAKRAFYHRTELGQILNVYGHMVSRGHWKDYAVDSLTDRAVFSIYRRASEQALYQIIKRPALRNKQGQYSVVAPGGLILKRGHDLKMVLRVFDKQRLHSLK